MKRLENKIAVITGGNSGIGFATAKEFISEGAKVIITGRNKETLDIAVKELGQNAYSVQSDVSKLSEIDKLHDEVKEKFGKIDILFANAGIFKALPIEETTEEFFDETIDINFKGVFFTVQKLLPLINDGSSVIFNATAITNKSPLNFTTSVYAASKAALVSLSRTLSKELVNRKIRVNVVSPGAISTPITGRLGLPPDVEISVKKGLATLSPLNRLGEDREIAKTVLFLASDESTFMYGSEIIVDGGYSQI